MRLILRRYAENLPGNQRRRNVEGRASGHRHRGSFWAGGGGARRRAEGGGGGGGGGARRRRRGGDRAAGRLGDRWVCRRPRAAVARSWRELSRQRLGRSG